MIWTMNEIQRARNELLRELQKVHSVIKRLDIQSIACQILPSRRVLRQPQILRALNLARELPPLVSRRDLRTYTSCGTSISSDAAG